MTVTELSEKLSLNILAGDGEKDVKGCYICDLLSRVMNGCQKDDVWITVQTSLNVVAVAVLTDAACVLLPEGIAMPENVLEKAKEEGVAILSSEKGAFELAAAIAPLLG